MPEQSNFGNQEKVKFGLKVCVPVLVVVVEPHKLPRLSARYVCEELNAVVLCAIETFSVNTLDAFPVQSSTSILLVPFQSKGVLNVNTLIPSVGT